MELGFVGLGNMGAKMAGRLVAAGHIVHVFDTNTASLDVLVGLGAKRRSSPRDVADHASVVFCSLPVPKVVETVVLGDEGLLKGEKCDAIVDLSTTGPTVAKRVAERVLASGREYLDAPVSGGVPGATAGTLAIMASGDRTVFDRLEPLIRVIGSNLFYVGAEPGLGQAMKLANNMLGAATMIASMETIVFGVKAGLDPKVMLDVINVSSGVNHHTQNKIPNSILNRSFPNNFATQLMLKDVRLGVEAAEEVGAPMWSIHAVRNFLAFAVTQGDGDIDWANGIKHFEKWAGVEVVSGAQKN